MASKLRQEIVGPFTGVTFEIRRVKISEYMREFKDLPFSIAPGTAEELNKIKESLESMAPDALEQANAKSLALFLSKGIVRMKYPDEEWIAPNLWFGAEDSCPEGLVRLPILAVTRT